MADSDDAASVFLLLPEDLRSLVAAGAPFTSRFLLAVVSRLCGSLWR